MINFMKFVLSSVVVQMFGISSAFAYVTVNPGEVLDYDPNVPFNIAGEFIPGVQEELNWGFKVEGTPGTIGEVIKLYVTAPDEFPIHVWMRDQHDHLVASYTPTNLLAPGETWLFEVTWALDPNRVWHLETWIGDAAIAWINDNGGSYNVGASTMFAQTPGAVQVMSEDTNVIPDGIQGEGGSNQVSEPGSLALLGFGILGLAFVTRKGRQ